MIRRQSLRSVNDAKAHPQGPCDSPGFSREGMLYHAGRTVEPATTPPEMKRKGSAVGKHDQLLVLGNGFDLQCGLKSAFTDFMKPRDQLMEKASLTWDVDSASLRKSPDEPYGELSDEDGSALVLKKMGLTAWDYILKEDEQERTWYDVEECIRTWVDYGTGTMVTPCSKHMQHIRSMRYPNWPGIETTAERAVYFFARDVYLTGKEGDPASILSVLLEELHRFEEIFADYLRKQQENNIWYAVKAAKLLNTLAADRVHLNQRESTQNIPCEELDGEDTALNFNYTQPIPTSSDIPSDMLNVHGLAENHNIIFGMDGKDLGLGQPYYTSTVKFTKTYRLMALSSRPHQTLVHPYVAGFPGSATGVIKFFGHSLGDADYSYFQAIFDEVNLYESDTHLVFYYNKNRSNETVQGKDVKEEMFEKVNRLITTYGATLDNKDHGRNLLHKLLLEGRLTIKQAPIER